MKKIILVIVSIISFYQISNSQTELWGMTSAGGQYGAGTIFKTDSSGNNQTVQQSFVVQNEGANPAYTQLTQASDGMLYGVTALGGVNNKGVLFQYDPSTSTYTKKLDFAGATNGRGPQGTLLQASDGKLYGMTLAGGANDLGVLFQYDPATSTYTKKLDFAGATNGRNPDGSLMQASDGKLYGMTTQGGANDNGVLFQYDPATSTYTKKLDFAGATSGSNPFGSLMQASDGKLYGMTFYGGVNGMGVLFQYDLVISTYTKKLDFAGATNGSNPYGSLMQASDGELYGMTYDGGANNMGVLFQYDPATSICTKKLDFAGATNGLYPHGSLMQASDGELYGMTYDGGANGMGVLFQYDPGTSIYTKKLDFAGATNGRRPSGPLMQASDGRLYGMTSQGGTNDAGVLFQYDPATSTYTKKLDFAGTTNGVDPQGSLIQASDGELYGMTSIGGVNGVGVLFQYDPATSTYTKKLDFAGATNGSNPQGSLLQASDGKLYGMTYGGGVNTMGVLFQYDPATSTYTKKLDFAGATNGSYPQGSLMQASDGNLYGMTYGGGTNNMGVLFQYDPATNTYTKELDFAGTTNGGSPFGSLMQASDGKLYGMTSQGGTNNKGVLFQYDSGTSAYTKNLDFAGTTNGSNPEGSLMQASDGKLYGMTKAGGAFNKGVLFQYNPTTSTYTNKLDFAVATNGANPIADLIEITLLASTSTTVCVGNSVVLTASGASTYTWSTGATTPTISVTPTTNTSYTITGTSAAGYTSTAVGIVTVIALPPVSVSSATTCAGSSTILHATGASTYSWNTGGTTSTISVMPFANTSYTVIGTNTSGCSNSQTVGVTVDNTCQDVWPGDANSDGIADNLDVLELGLHYTQTGAPRATVSNNWQSYFSNNWVGTITNGKNLNHSDCNGDGTINDDDTLAIYNNYSLTHAFKTTQTTTVNPQLSIVPDQAMVTKGSWGTASVYLGDATTNINNINGVAFTVDFDNTLVEPNSIYIEYQNSFIDASQNLHFRKLDFATGKLFTATTHTVNNNVSGFGKIATLHYQILSSLTTDQTLNIGLSIANQSDASGLITPLTSGAGTLLAVGSSVGIKETLTSNNVSVSPNPTSGVLNITFSAIPQNTKIEVYNSIGALVLTETLSNKNNTVNTSQLSNGMYLIKVLENNRITTVQKIVKN